MGLNKVKLISGVVFIALGVGAYAYSDSGNQSESINTGAQKTYVLKEKEEKATSNSELESLSNFDPNSIKGEKSDAGTPVGKLVIPSVNIEQDIYSGTSDLELLYGVGKLNGEPGGNVYTIVGHTMMNKPDSDKYLTPINKMVDGTKVYVYDENYVYEYEFKKMIQVKPSQTEAVWPRQGDKILNLVKCSDDGSERQVYRCYYISKMTLNKSSKGI